QGAQDLAVRVGRVDPGEVLGDGLAGDGEAVAVDEAGVEQRLHHHRDTADAVDVVHDVPAEGLEVAQVRDAVGDAAEVVQGELDLGLVGDGEQVEDRVGRATERHDHGDGVLQGLLRDDVAGGDALPQHLHDRLAAAAGEGVAAP